MGGRRGGPRAAKGQKLPEIRGTRRVQTSQDKPLASSQQPTSASQRVTKNQVREKRTYQRPPQKKSATDEKERVLLQIPASAQPTSTPTQSLPIEQQPMNKGTDKVQTSQNAPSASSQQPPSASQPLANQQVVVALVHSPPKRSLTNEKKQSLSEIPLPPPPILSLPNKQQPMNEGTYDAWPPLPPPKGSSTHKSAPKPKQPFLKPSQLSHVTPPQGVLNTQPSPSPQQTLSTEPMVQNTQKTQQLSQDKEQPSSVNQKPLIRTVQNITMPQLKIVQPSEQPQQVMTSQLRNVQHPPLVQSPLLFQQFMPTPLNQLGERASTGQQPYVEYTQQVPAHAVLQQMRPSMPQHPEKVLIQGPPQLRSVPSALQYQFVQREQLPMLIQRSDWQQQSAGLQSSIREQRMLQGNLQQSGSPQLAEPELPAANLHAKCEEHINWLQSIICYQQWQLLQQQQREVAVNEQRQAPKLITQDNKRPNDRPQDLPPKKKTRFQKNFDKMVKRAVEKMNNGTA